MGWDGQVALVTGAARGIGRAIAVALAERGADVALVDLNAEALAEAAAAVRAHGRRALTFAADVTDGARADTVVAETVAGLGRLDILVNNAGHGSAVPFLSITHDDWRRQIDLNLSAAFYYSQAAARVMRDRRHGRVIFVASVTGLAGPIDLAAYGAAKSGQYGLMRAMALELGEFGITANAVAPGPTNTELMRQTLTPEMQEVAALRIPARRIGEVEDVAQAVVYLASPEAAFINGVTVPVDGGFIAAGGYMAELFRRRRDEERG